VVTSNLNFDFLDSGVQIESPHTTQVKQFIFSQQNEMMTSNFSQSAGDSSKDNQWQAWLKSEFGADQQNQ
jgi:hypothetical protein